MILLDLGKLISRRATRARQNHEAAERRARLHAKQIAARLRRANRARGGDPILLRAAESLDQLVALAERERQ